jgi:prephenate dehydrogenase
MADKLQVSIIGLGVVGTSAGLALRRYADKLQVTGHDRDTGAAGKAKSMGAVDRTEWNLINAVLKADRILLCIPLAEIRETLDAIKQDLKPGVVILDTADVKAPVLQWANELLPRNAHFIGGHPILLTEKQDQASSSAELFERRIFCLTASGTAEGDAIQAATNLVEALGAQPFYMDAVEHDGLMAAVEQMPALVAGALAGVTTSSPAWLEMRKLAGGQYYAGSQSLYATGQAAARACLGNKENSLRWLAALQGELESWQTMVAAGDETGLTNAFENGFTARSAWLSAYDRAEWEESKATPMPTSGGAMRSLLGFGSWQRDRNKKGK